MTAPETPLQRVVPEYLAIPGPSIVPGRVLEAMAHPMVDIYDGELVEVTEEIYRRLPAVAGSTGEMFVTIGNGHAAWEMALANTLNTGDRVLVANCGVFARVWGEMARQNGLVVEEIDAPVGAAFDPDVLGARLADDVEQSIAAVLCVHADTASSARNDLAGFRAVMDATHHRALLMVDCIASLGCEPVEMDAWGADVVVGACQKGLMTPPGLGFNFAGPRAIEARERADRVSYYWDWQRRLDTSAHYLRYCGTPPVSHLYALRESLRMIDEETLPARFERHARLAAMVHAAVRAWHEQVGFSLRVSDPDHRSHSVTTIDTHEVDAVELRRVSNGLGVVLGQGLDTGRAGSFRIGHMGFVDDAALLGVIAAVDRSLGVMGSTSAEVGVAAAIECR